MRFLRWGSCPFFSLFPVFHSRRSFLNTIIIAGAFLLSLIPYVLFSISNPGALVARFKFLSYLYNPALSLFDKIKIYLENYISHFGFDFLLFTGDKNLRHATGYGGELFKNKFLLLMFICLLLSPVPSSLSQSPQSGEMPHALRSVLLGLFICLFSCYGLFCTLSLEKNRKPAILYD